jgi:MraZ protein
LVEEIKEIVGRQPTGSALREALELVYFGECEKLKVDPDGRTVLPKRLRDHAGITETAVFVGLGNKFQIWEPEAYNKFRERAREQALALRKELGAGSR